jgi:hypothetical protein
MTYKSETFEAYIQVSVSYNYFAGTCMQQMTGRIEGGMRTIIGIRIGYYWI